MAKEIFRKKLASDIEATLLGAGFYEEFQPSWGESQRTFTRPVVEDLRVLVKITIEKDMVTSNKRPIAVLLIYNSSRGPKTVLATTVTRICYGKTEKVTQAMLEAMRDMWRAAYTNPRCGKCGAPTYISKKGNQVCANMCWKV